MYNITHIRFKNFNTHIDSGYIFPKNGSVMISGVNVDKDGRSNGSGKSTIAEAISVALTGESFRHQGAGNTVKNLIRNGEKSMFVELTMSNDENSVVICREVFVGNKPSSLS